MDHFIVDCKGGVCAYWLADQLGKWNLVDLEKCCLGPQILLSQLVAPKTVQKPNFGHVKGINLL